MPPQDLLKSVRRRPFVPFRLHVSDGTVYEIKHPELLMVSMESAIVGLPAPPNAPAQIADFARNASWSNAVPLGLTILLWIAVCLAVQFVVTWWSGRRT